MSFQFLAFLQYLLEKKKKNPEHDIYENISVSEILIDTVFVLSGYHADTPITIKAEASSKADSRPN